MGEEKRAVRVRDFVRTFTRYETRRVEAGRPLTWIAVPVFWADPGFKRLQARANFWETYTAFLLTVQVAATMPARGLLWNGDREVTPLDIATRFGGPQSRARVFVRAFRVLCLPEIGLLEDCALSSDLGWVTVPYDECRYRPIPARQVAERPEDVK
jgi:hypothetical protein